MKGVGLLLAAVSLSLSLASAGCAGAGGGAVRGASSDADGPPDLQRARTAVAMAWASPLAPLALDAMEEAGDALEYAEEMERTRPGSQEARDAAYVAERKAERARLAALVEVNRDALHTAQRLHAQAERTAEARRAEERTAEARRAEEAREGAGVASSQ